MKYKSFLLVLASVFLATGAIFATSSVAAQSQGPMSVTDFREKFTEYVARLDSNTAGTEAPKNLAAKVQAMSDEEFQALYDAFENPDALIATTQQIMRPADLDQILQEPRIFNPQGGKTSLAPVTPVFPSGPDYNAWVASLPGLGLISDTDNDQQLNDEQCNSNSEARIAIAGSVFAVAAAAADTVCNSVIEGLKIIPCIAAGIAHEVDIANDIVNNQCSWQDGAVDSAELQATYENTLVLSGKVDEITSTLNSGNQDITDALQAHDTDIKTVLQANQQAVMNLIAANQAQSVKIEIEKALADESENKRLSSFYLPQTQGGLLETVRQTVQEAIDNNQAAGISVVEAKYWFAKAEKCLAKKDYKNAYDLYKKAYHEVVE